MIVVADASVLVAELIRPRGRALIDDSRLRVLVTEEQWSEVQYELDRRLSVIVAQGRLTTDKGLETWQDIQALFDNNAIEVVPRHVYDHMEAIARRRIPRDPNDWPTVALALSMNAGILTNDHDFLGCGCSTWTIETLRDELAGR